ncbi:protein FAM83H [Xyrichtys novacula]|uniref:Protein FAM83H n=1 Tax=Xyrichtys novacula TaxID=13765 RepID=A0AAV1G5X4_XYRNO|nr:protein FAM83H [Xyrichtys novacula]
MARRSQCSSAGDNPLDPNYLPPHYREEYRLAVDALVEEDLDGYYQFLLKADVVDFLSTTEIEYIQGSVRVPQHGEHSEHRSLQGGDDGSSDTYWPLQSDLDAPGLDLGWPQIHHFIGPTEVTTLVNPPEPDMPSIKEQARRLIKNAQQVVAIAMDMFTDVDIFADILAAAMRNVAVYILLDKENVHHFINMVSNCRVDLQSVQFLRVRTVSGITYHCRSGKSFKGQMMDRFLLTDCRAVLSGNYSFMWSFEKLHRCMAHLFLGQLVSTFDEEFRILFAQSEPLILENTLPPQVEDFNLLPKRKYSLERPLMYRESRKFLSLDTPHPEEWARHPHGDRTDLDWRMKRQEAPYGPDVYSRLPSQQSRIDPSLEQCPPRMPMMDPAFKRHSYAEGGHGRYSYPFLQPQGVPEPEGQGRQFHRGQQPYPEPGRDPEYGHERFWGQDFPPSDQFSDPGLPPEPGPYDSFDPVLNYLSSARNANFEGSEKAPPAADLLFSSSQPRRLSAGHPYVCQTSPTPSNPSEQKHFFLEPNPDRKDPTVKRGLRNWRISSFLSAHDTPEDDGRPSTPPNLADPFEDPGYQPAAGPDLSAPKIPNVREFKIPALPRASQMPGYIKTSVREQPKKPTEEPPPEPPKLTPTPSESSSTTEGEKMEEAEPREPRPLQREESFRRKYNAAVQRTSRLRSSLIFSSLDQQNSAQEAKTGPDEEGDKTESEQKKLSYVSPVFGQRRSATREPFEWSRYMKSSTFDNTVTDSAKVDEKDSEKDQRSENTDVKESTRLPPTEEVDPPTAKPESKGPEPKTDQLVPPVQPAKPPPSGPAFVDMSDPDARLNFFKELAAKRRAEKAAEAQKKKDQAPAEPPPEPPTVKTEEERPKGTSETKTDLPTSQPSSEKHAAAEGSEKTESTSRQHLDPKDQGRPPTLDLKTPQDSKVLQTGASADSESKETKISQSGEALQGEEPKEPEPSNSVEAQRSPGHPPTPTDPVPFRAPVAQSTKKPRSPDLDSAPQDPSSPTLSVETSSSSEPHGGSSGLTLKESGLSSSPSPAAPEPGPLSTPAQTKSSDVPSEDPNSTLISKKSEIIRPSDPVPISKPQLESTKARPDPDPQLISANIDSAVPSASDQSGVCPGSETTSLQSSVKTSSEEPSERPGSEKLSVSGSVPESVPESLLSRPPESCLPHEPDPKSETRSDHDQTRTPSADPLTDPDFTGTSLSQTDEFSDSSKQVTPPTELHLTPVPPPETGSGSSPESGPVLTPEADEIQTPPPDSLTTDPVQTSTPETLKQTEPETPESVPSGADSSDSPVPAENPQNGVSTESEPSEPGQKKTEDDNETTSDRNQTTEKTNEQPEPGPEEVGPPTSQSKKSSQSRYLSSTANVLSSSNLRDDTKLLLEQISANSQSRNEAPKESPVTDDEKEDEADKNAKKDKDRGIRFGRAPPKTEEERDKLLERIQSMRKERRVYSRWLLKEDRRFRGRRAPSLTSTSSKSKTDVKIIFITCLT